MALKREDRETFASQIGVNRGTGFSALAQTSRNQASRIEESIDKFSQRSIQRIREKGQRTGKDLAETYTPKIESRTFKFTDSKGRPRTSKINIVAEPVIPERIVTKAGAETFERLAYIKYETSLKNEARNLITQSANEAKFEHLNGEEFAFIAASRLQPLIDNSRDSTREYLQLSMDQLIKDTQLDIQAQYDIVEVKRKVIEATSDFTDGFALAEQNLNNKAISDDGFNEQFIDDLRDILETTLAQIPASDPTNREALQNQINQLDALKVQRNIFSQFTLHIDRDAEINRSTISFLQQEADLANENLANLKTFLLRGSTLQSIDLKTIDPVTGEILTQTITRTEISNALENDQAKLNALQNSYSEMSTLVNGRLTELNQAQTIIQTANKHVVGNMSWNSIDPIISKTDLFKETVFANLQDLQLVDYSYDDYKNFNPNDAEGLERIFGNPRTYSLVQKYINKTGATDLPAGLNEVIQLLRTTKDINDDATIMQVVNAFQPATLALIRDTAVENNIDNYFIVNGLEGNLDFTLGITPSGSAQQDAIQRVKGLISYFNLIDSSPPLSVERKEEIASKTRSYLSTKVPELLMPDGPVLQEAILNFEPVNDYVVVNGEVAIGNQVFKADEFDKGNLIGFINIDDNARVSNLLIDAVKADATLLAMTNPTQEINDEMLTNILVKNVNTGNFGFSRIVMPEENVFTRNLVLENSYNFATNVPENNLSSLEQAYLTQAIVEVVNKSTAGTVDDVGKAIRFDAGDVGSALKLMETSNPTVYNVAAYDTVTGRYNLVRPTLRIQLNASTYAQIKDFADDAFRTTDDPTQRPNRGDVFGKISVQKAFEILKGMSEAEYKELFE